MSRKSQLRPALSEDLFSSEEDTQLHSPPIGDIQADNQPDTQPDSQQNVLQESQQVMELDSQPLDIESIAIPVPSRQDSRSIAVEEQENTQYRGAQKEKKLTRVSFDDATEVELAEWYSNNRMFYDKSLKEYKDTEKKKRIMEEKASSLNNPVTGAQLTVWFNGMRTRYGRLSEASKKSGRGAASSLSVRDQWILRTFSFLHSHIVRCPSRQTAKFSQRSPSPSHVSYNVDGEVMSEGGGEAEDTDDPASHNADIAAGPSGEASTSMASSHTSKGKGRKVVGEETHELLAKLLSRADEVTDLKQRVRDLTQSTDPFHKKIDAWVSYFAAELHDFKPQVWNRFVSAATQLLHKYKQENDALDLGPPAATTEVQPSSHPPKVATATTTAVSLPPAVLSLARPNIPPFPQHQQQLWASQSPAYGRPSTPIAATLAGNPPTPGAYLNLSGMQFFNTSGANLNTSGIATPPHDANFMNPTPPIRTSTPRPTSQNQEY